MSLLLALAGVLQGCPQRNGPDEPLPQPSGSDGPTDDSALSQPVRDFEWPFWPAKMRLHPLTRLARDEQTGQPIVECRLEFLDSEGQTTKAVGQLALQIYPESGTPAGPGALETWNQDLRDLEVNRRQYDEVTRTYLFRLQITQPLPAGCELRALFLSSNAQRMSAEMRLRQ